VHFLSFPPWWSVTLHSTLHLHLSHTKKVARTLLAKYAELSFAAAVAGGDANVALDDDPNLFEVLLGFMRTGRLYPPHGVK
jgi:hypothetical protein